MPQFLRDLNDTADRFLSSTVSQYLKGEPPGQVPTELTSAEGVAALTQRLEFHGISVFLGQQADKLSGWPDWLTKVILQETRLAALWEETHRRVIARLIEKLAHGGIESLVMKGTALAYLHYDDPAIRRRGDTDLLIRPEDLGETRRMLEAEGFYQREDPHGLYFQETWLRDFGADITHAIDLHWAPADRPMIQRLLQEQEYWANPVAIPALGEQAQGPDSTMMIVHGAVNQAWHVSRGFFVDDQRIKGGRRLIWSIDYLYLTKGLSDQAWERLVKFCETHDAASIVFAALDGARQDIPITIPQSVLERLEVSAKDSPTHSYIATPNTISDFLTDFRAADTTNLKLKLLFWSAFAPRHHLLDKYPDLDCWPTFALLARWYFDLLTKRRRGSTER